MPNTASAKKELRKSIKRNARNEKIEKNLKDLIKKSRRVIEAKDGAAKELLNKALKALDKAAKQGVIKKIRATGKNQGSIKNSTKLLNKS